MGTVSEQLIAKFKERGMRFVFGVPSGSWLYYMEAMRKQGLDFVLVANEASAGFMADVCARLTGIPAACYGTVGPGATNLSTGVLGAYLDRSPMIALSSEPPEHMLGRTVQMAFDQQAFFRPLTKWTTRLSAERLDQIVDQAYRIALSETPGPVHIGLTEDIGGREAVSPGSSTQIPGSLSKPVPASEALLKQLEKSFNASRKPLIAVGLSAVRAKAGPLIAAIAEKHRIPVVLTPMAKGILSEDHPWYAGVLFHALSDRVAETHKQADLVIGVGYDPVEFNYEDWMPKAPLLSLDTVEADIDRSTYSGVCDIVGDITTSLGYLASLPAKSTEWDQGALEERKERMFADLA
ncbi:MAG: thiamine pyrophosphate-binding protein, partial [Spirochaetales bacterium]|nr:thiamine pyrophosphate-binding protein [Spirochaetales bacterium]